MSLSSKTIYFVYSGDGHTFKLQTEEGVQPRRGYEVYESQKLTSSVEYQYETTKREPPLTQKHKKNKRDIAGREEHTLQPSRKERKVFTGNYFV